MPSQPQPRRRPNFEGDMVLLTLQVCCLSAILMSCAALASEALKPNAAWCRCVRGRLGSGEQSSPRDTKSCSLSQHGDNAHYPELCCLEHSFSSPSLRQHTYPLFRPFRNFQVRACCAPSRCRLPCGVPGVSAAKATIIR